MRIVQPSQPTARTFKSITLNDWRQFANISVDLGSRLTILTGPNGSGKTTLLNVLGHHFGWVLGFSTPPTFSKSQRRKIYSDVAAFLASLEASAPVTPVAAPPLAIGHILYDNGQRCGLHRPDSASSLYRLTYSGIQNVPGYIIPSHSPPPGNVTLSSIPLNPTQAAKNFRQYQQLLLQLYGSADRIQMANPSRVLKEWLIALAVFAYDTNSIQGDPNLRDMFEGFQEVLRHTLPAVLGFEKIEVQPPDIVLVTKSGRFAMDAMSGGVAAILMMSWQLFMSHRESASCTIIIDEPENHLHPSMQRELLPSLMAAFPQFHFIIATHSPFIITSSAQANVYAFLFDDRRKVSSQQLTQADLAGSPNTVLKDILGVEPVPQWVEKRVAEILDKHKGVLTDAERAQAIYNDLRNEHLLGPVAEKSA